MIGSSIVKNFLVRTIGSAALIANRAAWNSLRVQPYKNELFTIGYEPENNNLHVRPTFSPSPIAFRELLMAHEFLDGGVRLSDELEVDGDSLKLDCTERNLPGRWCMMLNDHLNANGFETELDVGGSGFNYMMSFNGYVDLFNKRVYRDGELIVNPDRVSLINDTNADSDLVFTPEIERSSKVNLTKFGVGDRQVRYTAEVIVNNGPYVPKSIDISDHVATPKNLRAAGFTSYDYNYGKTNTFFGSFSQRMWDMVSGYDTENREFWGTFDGIASPSAEYFMDNCNVSANDNGSYGVVYKAEGGIRIPHTKQSVANMMLENKEGDIYQMGILRCMMNNKHSYRLDTHNFVSMEDLVVLTENINRAGGSADIIVKHYASAAELEEELEPIVVDVLSTLNMDGKSDL